MQWNGLYKEMNPPERRDEHSSRKEREREREKKCLFCKNIILAY